MRKGFTLIELLIVVAIIAILAAIAVPNFLEAQTRSKVSRAKSDLRALATAIESYGVDHNNYPEGTDNPSNYPERIEAFLTPLGLQKGFYSFRSRGGAGLTVGRDFAGITTPIAYISSIPTDIFAGQASSILTYCYRNSKNRKNAWVLTSAGPDADLLAGNGRGNSNTANPLSTAGEVGQPRLADVSEIQVINFFEANAVAPATIADLPKMRQYLEDLSYDPTNGTISDGDIIRIP